MLLEAKTSWNWLKQQIAGQPLIEMVEPPDRDIVAHLKRRGLDPKKTRVILDKETDSAVFLLFNLSGQLIGYQQYNPAGSKKGKEGIDRETAKYWTWVTREGNKRALAVWGLETMDDRPFVFLVEGIFDAVKLHNADFPALAVLGNNPKMLASWLKVLNKQIIVIADNDKAGNKLKKLGNIALTTPEPYKDLGEMPQEQIKPWLTESIPFL